MICQQFHTKTLLHSAQSCKPIAAPYYEIRRMYLFVMQIKGSETVLKLFYSMFLNHTNILRHT